MNSIFRKIALSSCVVLLTGCLGSESNGVNSSDNGALIVPASFSSVASEAGVTEVIDHGSIGMGVMAGGAAVADVDGDGLVDIYITCPTSTDFLYKNNGDGTFSDITVIAGFTANHKTNGAGFADIDNDGDQDLYLTTLGESQNYLYINDGTGVFAEEAILRGANVAMDAGYETQRNGQSVSFGDYNLDGLLDIHTNDWQRRHTDLTTMQTASRLLKNTGNGNFIDVTDEAMVATQTGAFVARNNDTIPGIYSFTSRFADINNDGYPDLLVAADFETSRMFVNNGDGTFADMTLPWSTGTDKNGMGTTVADYDNDGDLDWFVSAITHKEGNRLYRNDYQSSNSGFTDVTDFAGVRDGGWGWGSSFLDYDNDGYLDLVHTNGWSSSISDPTVSYVSDQVRLYRNNRDGTYTDIASSVGITDTGEGRGLLTFDYDNDGDLDIFIINNNAMPVLYKNDAINGEVSNGNHWLKVKTKGVMSNADGLGAWITIDRDLSVTGDELYRDVFSGSNFLSASESTVHVGLGDLDGTIDKVEIHWPSGIRQSYFDVEPDQVITLHETLGLI